MFKKLREGWRRARERETRIDNAINTKLETEHKLALLRNRASPVSEFFPMIVILFIFALLLSSVIGIANINYGLKYHFGENVWENMRGAGKAEFGLNGGNPHLVLWVLFGLGFALFVLMLYRMFRVEKEIARLERRILTLGS